MHLQLVVFLPEFVVGSNFAVNYFQRLEKILPPWEDTMPRVRGKHGRARMGENWRVGRGGRCKGLCVCAGVYRRLCGR